MAEIENSASQASGESSFLLSDNHVKSEQSVVEPTLPVKKKRNLPGMPDPDAEVIALSPKTLMATNRFVCEICNKGFQRDQNLQLHRRGHNLPWKLRQRTNKEVRKRVYLCPEPTCIHHDPSRALGDLTGIKKHFCRKHGEKKFKCERCSKKYAVQSDWKAHMKTCGTREYRCDCGTLFSRRDSFITHRAFCDALAQESALAQPLAITSSGGDMTKLQVVAPPVTAVVSSPPPPPLTPSTGVLSPVMSIQSSELPENHTAQLRLPPGAAAPFAAIATVTASNSSTSSGNVTGNGGVFASIFNVPTSVELSHSAAQPPVASYSTMLCTMAGPDQPVIDPMSLSLCSTLYLPSGSSSLYPAALEHSHRHYTPTPQPALSATALLQKAAQMGATSSNSSFLRGLGLATTPPDRQDSRNSIIAPSHWNNTTHVKLENSSVAPGLGLGLPSSSSPASFNELMMNSSSLFGNRPTTLDFLGLGMGAGEAPSGGFSAFLSSITDGLDMTTSNSFAGVGSTVDTWDYPSDTKPSML